MQEMISVRAMDTVHDVSDDELKSCSVCWQPVHLLMVESGAIFQCCEVIVLMSADLFIMCPAWTVGYVEFVSVMLKRIHS